jgi:hypothetical protein
MNLRPSCRLSSTALALATLALPASAQEEGLVNRDMKQWRGIAHLKTIRTKAKLYKAVTQYPVFNSRTPVARYANVQLKKWAIADYNDFIRESKRDIKAGAVEADRAYEYQAGPMLGIYAPPRLISVTVTDYRYLGGAHGLAVISGTTFGTINGKPKVLMLGDLFVPGTPYRATVEKAILAKLKQNPGADWVRNGEVKTLTPDQLNNFIVKPDGVEWSFSPYDMGPYSSGIITAKLSPAELGPGLKKSWLWGK